MEAHWSMYTYRNLLFTDSQTLLHKLLKLAAVSLAPQTCCTTAPASIRAQTHSVTMAS